MIGNVHQMLGTAIIMGVTLSVLDLAPDCQLDKFQNKLNCAKKDVATLFPALILKNCEMR